MNLFSNIGIGELLLILLLALLVVGPERLPELGRKLARTLREVRKVYNNLTRDLGPELMSLQRSTLEIREAVESVSSIPQDLGKAVIKAAALEDTIQELKQVTEEAGQIGQTLSAAEQAIKSPVKTAATLVHDSLTPAEPAPTSGEASRAVEPIASEPTETTGRE